jgi:hypothetical protein
VAAIYFMGVVPEVPDGTYQQEKRCTCLSQANIQVVVAGGDISAWCPVCRKEYVVLVETGHEGVHFLPVSPDQII